MTETPAPKKRGIKAGTKNALKAEDKRVTAVIQLRVTQAQKEIYTAYAENCGLSLTKLLTNLADAAINADKFKI